MRRKLRIAAVGVSALACAASAFSAVSLAGTANANREVAAVCSRAAATQAIDGLHVTGGPYVRAVLCGAFTGPGSRTMVATTGLPPGANHCVILSGWFVFRDVNGSWQSVQGGVHFPVPVAVPLIRSGSNLVERDLIHLPGTPDCDIRGVQERTWHWTGTRLVAGAYQFVMPTGTVENFNWFSPDRGIWCSGGKFGTFNEITCATKDIQNGATLKHTGALRICDHPPGDSCVQNWGDKNTPVLLPSQQLNINGFHCTSEPSAISCAVVTGAGRGRGFRLTSAGQATRL